MNVAVINYFFCILMVSVLSDELVNINDVSVEELENSLTGVGPKQAMARIEYIETNGPFFSAEELIKVNGVDQKTLEKNKENIQVRYFSLFIVKSCNPKNKILL